MANRALVGNASSPKQTQAAARYEKRRDDENRAALAAVLATSAGIRTMAVILNTWSAFTTPYDESPTRMAFLVGKQDVAHWLIHQIEDADPPAMGRIVAESQRMRAEMQHVAGNASPAETEPTESDTTESEPDA